MTDGEEGLGGSRLTKPDVRAMKIKKCRGCPTPSPPISPVPGAQNKTGQGERQEERGAAVGPPLKASNITPSQGGGGGGERVSLIWEGWKGSLELRVSFTPSSPRRRQ